VARSVFSIMIALVVYTWIGYPLALALLRLFRGRKTSLTAQADDPFVSIIVPVHNEEQKISGKLGDCLDLLYPTDKVEIIVASDGSTDGTKKNRASLCGPRFANPMD